MQFLRTFGLTMAVAAAFILAAGLAPGSARAASTVDVTYDLADTTLEGLFGFAFDKVVFVSNDNPANGTIAGSMKVGYTSNSQSSIPIQPGPVSLLSLDLTLQSFTVAQIVQSGTASPKTASYRWLSGNLHWQLTGGPVTGNLTSGGALTGLFGNIHLTGTAKCHLPYPYSFYCGAFIGIKAGVTAQINRYYSGYLNLAGSPGPSGGAQSTRHTLTGGGPVSAAFKNAFQLNTTLTHNGYGGAQLVGREILREGGGKTKPVPEPGTLLLLAAGTAGLALVGHATQRRR